MLKRKAYCHVLLCIHVGCREIVGISLQTLAGVMCGAGSCYAAVAVQPL